MLNERRKGKTRGKKRGARVKNSKVKFQNSKK
jgi:hypothetical protein